MRKLAVINAVGLTRNLVGQYTPRLAAFARRGAVADVGPVLPAVTTSVQSTYLTGTWPSEHGIVGNGWYFRDECEVKFWRQASQLVRKPRIWELARGMNSSFTCANLFWWYAMYSSADVTVTPRPMYPADGRKIPDVWTHPAPLRQSLQEKLGPFPLFKFWGPQTSIEATQWIADAAIAVDREFSPTLSLVYLPHLDYSLQKLGPDPAANAEDLAELDKVCGELIDHFHSRDAAVVILSEYGISPVSRAVHLNRVLRENGLITVREELGRELLDAGASTAFAVADHQLAHVYVNDKSRIGFVKKLLEETPGVERVLDEAGKIEARLSHDRAGELVAIAEEGAWFTYYYWIDEAKRPDFANTVDIHRKPGYDPAELFFDPKLRFPMVKAASTLLRRKMGMRAMMNVIGTDASLVRGSHGREVPPGPTGPLLMTDEPELLPDAVVPADRVCSLLLTHLNADGGPR